MIGTHGTCRTYAELIDKFGFKASAGWHGYGIYFWESDPDLPEEAQDLAKTWVEMRIDKKGPHKYPDSDCVVYSVDVCDKAPSLNMRSDKNKKALKEFTKEYLEKTEGLLKHNDKSLIFDEFISTAERDMKIKYAVLKTEDVAPTPKRLNYLHILPSYNSITVIDVKCIEILSRD